MESKNIHLEIDPGLWREFKAACAYYGISIKATLIKHVQNIVNDYRKDKSGFTDNGVMKGMRKGT